MSRLQCWPFDKADYPESAKRRRTANKLKNDNHRLRRRRNKHGRVGVRNAF